MKSSWWSEYWCGRSSVGRTQHCDCCRRRFKSVRSPQQWRNGGKIHGPQNAVAVAKRIVSIWHFLHQILESSASGSKPDLKSGPSETVRVQLLYSPPNLWKLNTVHSSGTSTIRWLAFHGSIAHLVELSTDNRAVTGSSPVTPTK